MNDVNISFEAIGTHWNVDIHTSLDTQGQEKLFTRIRDRIELFEHTYSRFRFDSLITKMSEEAGEYFLPEDAVPLMELYKKLYDITGGTFTPLIGQTLVEAGYDANYSLQPKTLHQPPKWEDVMELRGNHLFLKQKALLDVGAIGKGYLIDLVSEILEQEGIDSYCVDAGGDIRHRNAQGQSLRIGLEHPDDFEKVIGVVNLSNKSLCGSSGSRRKWGKFHHILNPVTLDSPHEILAVWVEAESTMLADGISTCLFFVPPATLQKHFEFEYLVLRDDYMVEKSENFDAELF